ncbi:sensor histidine kinase [Streptomyces litchfieldiae]|uniref:Histidine kinase n=1 Tax=Streptomyces litchfieldiae TaxID=3075543 RepID=A0ABU2MWQ0_9ACTN|nr:histidine kinase [Streptomyces sp. DSM 44938]MDT0346083.1 histidine kinase [Streptomyces sp. DSM 44938]
MLQRMRRKRAGEGATVRVLGVVQAVDADLRDGLGGRGAVQAARRLRRLLAADTVVLADLDGPVAVAGPEPDAAPLAELLAQTYEHANPAHRPPWTAEPLIVAGELSGALAVRGGAGPDIAAVATLVARSLDHAALRRARSRIAQADLRTLRAQISPHFLHNALAVIGARIRTDPDRARTLLNDFADYLRYSFAARGDYATVADELQAIQTYLELQRARFDDRMELSVRMAPEILPVAIPFLVIQPIVENAVRHGLEPKPGPGAISVRGFGEGPLCVIEIEDDGVGMDPEFAQAILAGKERRDDKRAGGVSPDGARRSVGLANVDQRLRAVYGPEYGLVIETAPGSGTKVIVRVPRFNRTASALLGHLGMR